MNDSAGIVTDLDALDQGIQVIFEDFDNDGLLDILVANRINGGHRLFWNLGNMVFDHVTNLFPSGIQPIHSAAVGDLNHDGFIDIFAGHGSGYNTPATNTSSVYNDDLFLNDGNDNHFLSIRTIGDESNINGIGTRLVLLSDLGVQRRDIRSGESYGIMNSLNAHFGMGEDENVDSLILYWPSGETDLFENLRADQFLTLHEGIGPCDCNEPNVQTVTSLTGNGAGSLPYVVNQACPCDTITFHAALDFDTIVLAERLMIGKDLVIKGRGALKTWISTTTSTAAIRIQPGIQCTLSQLTLDDDASIPPIYLIENLGSLTLEGVTVDAPVGVPLRPVGGTWIIGSGTTILK
jgi:hypothetical protein